MFGDLGVWGPLAFSIFLVAASGRYLSVAHVKEDAAGKALSDEFLHIQGSRLHFASKKRQITLAQFMFDVVLQKNNGILRTPDGFSGNLKSGEILEVWN